MDKKEKINIINIEEIKEAKLIASLSEKVNNLPISISELVKEVQERPSVSPVSPELSRED